MLDGYWTIFSGEQAVMACTSFESAWRLVWEITQAQRLEERDYV